MLEAYFNYPVSKVSVHRNGSCGNIRMMNKPNQRQVRIEIGSLSSELRKFSGKEYAFASSSYANDMWLRVDLKDEIFEIAVVEYIRRLLGRHYKRFEDGKVEIHC